MIVCVCRRVSHRDIENEVRSGCSSFDALRDELGVADACGGCIDCARDTFERACAQHQRTAGRASATANTSIVHFAVIPA